MESSKFCGKCKFEWIFYRGRRCCCCCCWWWRGRLFFGAQHNFSHNWRVWASSGKILHLCGFDVLYMYFSRRIQCVFLTRLSVHAQTAKQAAHSPALLHHSALPIFTWFSFFFCSLSLSSLHSLLSKLRKRAINLHHFLSYCVCLVHIGMAMSFRLVRSLIRSFRWCSFFVLLLLFFQLFVALGIWKLV